MARTAWPVRSFRYGPSAEHGADLRLPEGPGPHPVAVLIHGGFWGPHYRRDLMDGLAVDLARRGWASWNIEYRRIGSGGGVPATLEDVHAATAALETVEAPLDRRCVVPVGHSAGGYLALWLAGTGSVTGAVGLAGVCHLEAAARERPGRRAVVAFLGGRPEEVPEAFALADLGGRLPTGVPQVLLHGDRDGVVSAGQSRWYAERCAAAGDPCTLVVLPHTGHFELIDPATGAWDRAATALDSLRPAPSSA